MITPVILPQLGDTMDEGTITRWFKRPGDAVKKGEPLFEVLTDKANIEVEATADGFLRRVLYQENETVPTGKTIAFLATTRDEPLPESVQGMPAPPSGPTVPEAVGTVVEPQGEGDAIRPGDGSPRRRQFISPRARRVAREFGIDVTLLAPSSRTGRIMEADVRKFLAQQPTPMPHAPTAPPAAPAPTLAAPAAFSLPPTPSPAAPDTILPVTGVRKIIFDRMGASSRQVARVTLTTEADATELVALREQLNAHQKEMRFSFTDLLVLLVSRALLKYPYMNSTLRDDGVHRHASVHMGVAADTERGLLVPVVRAVERKSLGEIYGEVRRLSEAARTGKSSPDDLRGSTFTITNLGQYEVDAFTPIVNQPETAILGVGRIAQKAAAFQGQLAVRWMLTLSLSFDHRIVDGAPAARFLQEVKHLIESPALVLI